MKTASLTFWFACMVEGTVSPPLQKDAQLPPSQSTKESLKYEKYLACSHFQDLSLSDNQCSHVKMT